MIRRLLPAAVLPLLAIACGGGTPPADTTPSPSATTASATPPATAPMASATAPATAEAPKPEAPKEPTPPTPALVWKDMATPESVLYDEKNDRYLVSNINGKPLEADNNGFISELSPDGKVTKLKFIEGGQNKVTLNAPKGTAIVKGVLYVADIDHVRLFDAKTGAPKGDVEVKGATFLNDLTASPDGKVYVTDSGMKQGEKDFEPTGTDAVYLIEKGKATALASSKDLNRPNGILWTKAGLLVNTFGAKEIYRLNEKYDATKAKDPKVALKFDVTEVAPALDGLVSTGDALLTSSWGTKTIYKGKLGGSFEAILVNVKAPADIGYDTKRKRVLVPRFLDNQVDAYDLK